ncbi:MAG TPA: phosphate acyltransferase PlsX [Clostridiaceae bacterium]|nr:phosphate acyltransferase PlsX [Clostridiaceae bacterium]
MGGDNAPEAIVNGCIDAINSKDGFDVMLIGDSEQINEVLRKKKFSSPRLKIYHTDEVITNEDIPTKAIKTKQNSSMVVGFKLLKDGEGDVFLSAGNSGALLTGALLILGRIKGVDRPALGAVIPAKNGNALIIDAGLNSSCKPINYLQFGLFGSLYMKKLYDIKNPTVGLLNVGAESGKGNELIKQAYGLLSNSNLNFIGNIEGKDIPEGKVHVAVCDGFTGNVLLKFYEGAGTFFFGLIKSIFTHNIFTKLSALLLKKNLKNLKSLLDPDVLAGAPILGVNGLVIKSHGNSKARTIKYALLKAYKFAEGSMLDHIKEELKNLEVISSGD